MMRNIISGCALGFACVSSAFAQTPPPALPAPPAQPALVVEKIHSGWLFSPDVRATDLDGKTGALAGGYVGRITDRSWVIGAGGYYLTNRQDDFKLWYGGPVLEWLVRSDKKIGFGVRTLVGAGSGILPMRVGDFLDPRRPAATARDGRRDSRPELRQFDPNLTLPVSDDFFVAEPQLNVMLNVSQGQRIVFGVGYRVVGNAALLGDELRGLSGSVSVQFGGK